MKTSKVFDKMLEIFDTYGWCQNYLGDEHTGYCLAGARQKAATEILDDPFDNDVKSILIDLIPSKKMDVPWAIESKWNDKKGRTKKQVIKLVKQARDIALSMEMSNRK